jgi:deoxyribodipyrimidine photo-lyase
MKTSIFWFRRDLRLFDNTALNKAIEESDKVILVFIFDTVIIEDLEINDARVTFIHKCLIDMNKKLLKHNASIEVYHGNVIDVWKEIIKIHDFEAVYINKDYEPSAIERDCKVRDFLYQNHIELNDYKDQVIFEEKEILKKDGKPYTIFTPYKNKWLEKFNSTSIEINTKTNFNKFQKSIKGFPTLDSLGFKTSSIKVLDYKLSVADEYDKYRNYPSLNATSYLGPHLRFGTVSIRQIVEEVKNKDVQFLYELIWREFFMQILFNFPKVETQSFKEKYEKVKWRNNIEEFDAWCQGKTGFPMVDAGMRELNTTGYMHNRVRMVTASFLVKNLLIDWRWGESYFAQKLLDYELSSNNGNWQWAAGCGCDAAPYFRIFNPSEQIKRFDKDYKYIKNWVPEFGTDKYAAPIVGYKFSRVRVLEAYKKIND